MSGEKSPVKSFAFVCDRSDRSSSLKIRSCRDAFFLPQQSSMDGWMDGSGRLTSRENLSKPTRHSIKQLKISQLTVISWRWCPIRMLVSIFCFVSLTKRFGKSECWAKLSLILLASCRCASVTSHLFFSSPSSKIFISQYFPYHFAPLGKQPRRIRSDGEKKKRLLTSQNSIFYASSSIISLFVCLKKHRSQKKAKHSTITLLAFLFADFNLDARSTTESRTNFIDARRINKTKNFAASK